MIHVRGRSIVARHPAAFFVAAALLLAGAQPADTAKKLPKSFRGWFQFTESGGESLSGCDYFEDQVITVSDVVLRKAGRYRSWEVYRLDPNDPAPSVEVAGSSRYRCPPSQPGEDPLIDVGRTSPDPTRRPSVELLVPRDGDGTAYLGFVVPVSEEITRISGGSGTHTELDIRALIAPRGRLRTEPRYRIGKHSEGANPRGGANIDGGFYFEMEVRLSAYYRQ